MEGEDKVKVTGKAKVKVKVQAKVAFNIIDYKVENPPGRTLSEGRGW
jgi:hypothetical protein